MNSRIISTIKLEDDLLGKDLEKLSSFGDTKEEYSEYRFGIWKNYVLWNGTGEQSDTLFQGLQGGGVQTQMGQQLEYINSIILENFHVEKLKMVRANLLKDALLIPHRDYLEFKADSEKLARLHIPLKTDKNSLHSEDDSVFHMRKGEVWYLDVSHIHSACNSSENPRISLVLDFGIEGEPLESVFKTLDTHSEPTTPMIIEREKVDKNFLNSIMSLKYIINELNYKDIVLLLARIHFYKNINIAVFFDWLIDICKEVEDESLLQKSIKFKEYLINDRELSQRFYL